MSDDLGITMVRLRQAAAARLPASGEYQRGRGLLVFGRFSTAGLVVARRLRVIRPYLRARSQHGSNVGTNDYTDRYPVESAEGFPENSGPDGGGSEWVDAHEDPEEVGRHPAKCT